MFRRVWAGLLSLLLVVCTLATAAPSAHAAMAEEDYLLAARQLNKYGLVQGDDQGYRFYSQITRAEMAKLLVYSLGLQNDASRYIGRGIFSDTEGHWAEGIIAIAKTAGIMRGYPEGDFRPQAPLTYAEVITALSRLVGLESSGEPWPTTYLNPATQAGIIPEPMNVRMMLGEPAARGDVFVMLWRTLTVVKNAQGQNLLRRYLDTSAPTLTIDPQPKETTDLTLLVSGTVKDADQVLVNGEPADVTFGAFRQEVPLRVGPNTVRIQAVDAAGNLREETLQIARKQSPIGTVAIAGPAQVKVGQAATYTISLTDQNGEPIADRKGMTAEVLPASLGSFDPVTGLFTAGTAPGTGTITVKAGPALASASVSVLAGSLDRIAIEPPVAAADAKATVPFTVKGFDQYGNPVPVGSVQWSASGGTITATTGVFTAPDKAGTFTITAQTGGKVATASVQPPNYKAASVRITQPTTTLKANGISEMILTATVLDDKGNTLTDYAGSLTLSSSVPGVAYPVAQTAQVSAGVAQFNVRAGTTPGTVQIHAATNLTVSGATALTVQPQRLQSVKLVGQAVPGSTSTYPTGYVEAIALDEDGNPMRSALPQVVVLQVTLSASGGAAGTAWFMQNDQPQANVAVGPLDSTTGDVRTRTYIQYNRGIGTMLIEGTVASTTMSWVQVLAGALRADQVGMPAQLRIEPIADATAGTNRDIFVVVLDSDGYRVTQPNPLSGVTVTLKDQNGVPYPGSSNLATDGPGRWRFPVTQASAGTYTYTATLQPGGATTTATARVTSGSIADVILTATPDTIQADNSSQTTLRARLVDALGNTVTDGSYKVIFHLQAPGNGALQPFADRTVTSVNGVAETTLRAGTVRAWDDVVATVDGHPLWTDTKRITTRGVAERLAFRFGDNNGNAAQNDAQDHIGRAGTAMVVHVDVMDRFSGLVADDNGRQVTLTARSSTGIETPVGTVTTASGRATFYVTLPNVGTYALRAQSTNLTSATSLGYGGSVPDLVLEASHTLRVAVTSDIEALRPGGGVNYAMLSAKLIDANNNPVTNQSGRPLTVILELPPDSTGVALGKFTTNDQPNGPATRMRSVEIPPGASVSNTVKFFSETSVGDKVITWRSQDGQNGTLTVSTIASTDVTSLQITAPSAYLEPWTVGAPAVTGQTVEVVVRGTEGRRLSYVHGSVTLTMKDADTRIVAVWDAATQRWTSTWDGAAYPSTAQVHPDRGRALYRVRANTSGAKLYEAQTLGGSGGITLVTAQANTVFYPNGAEYLAITPAAPRIDGNDTITLTASVKDRFGSTVTTATGNVTVRLPAGAPGVFTTPATAVPLSNGEAQVTFRADGVYRNADTNVPITVETTVLNPLTNTYLTQTVTLVVDDAAPRVANVQFSNKTGGTVNLLEEGDSITLRLNEPIVADSLVTGLSPATPVAGGQAVISGSTITFTGMGQLGSIKLVGPQFGSNATFNIASVSIGSDAMTVSIKLGGLAAGTAPTVSVGSSTMAEVNLGATVIDEVGNPVTGPFTSVPVTGAP